MLQHLHTFFFALLAMFLLTGCAAGSLTGPEETNADNTSNDIVSNGTASNGTGDVECAATACSIGLRICSGEDQVQSCEPDKANCGSFVLSETCTDGASCADGVCSSGCIDQDGDRHGIGCAAGSDCDDDNPNRYISAIEVCDNLDNDCDGIEDEGDVCAPDCAQEECSPGVRGCVGSDRLRECQPDPTTGCGRWGEAVECGGPCLNDACQDSVDCIDQDGDLRGENCPFGPDCDDSDFNRFPGNPELCDGVNNDCDDAIDEDFPALGQSCINGVGACAQNGSFGCGAGGTTTVCNAQDSSNPNTEWCGDNLDNDCDGQTDEGFDSVGMDCADGMGACRNEGQIICFGTSTVCSASAGSGSTEVCDNVDNDCDGQTDEGGVCNQPTECVEDSLENNDTSASGTSIARGASRTAQLCGFRDNLGNNTLDQDWFRLGQYNAGETITVDIDFDNPEAFIHLEIYNGTLNKANSANQRSGHRLTHTVTSSGTFTLWVYAWENGQTGTPYTIHHR